jgi:hypothetical protein
VLSAPLFAFFVDNLLTSLDNYGCRLSGLNLGSLMYADDLLLLSPSVGELQIMIDIVCHELNELDLKLNASKSCCIRIGKRFHADCVCIQSSAGPIPWQTKTSYLGVILLSARKFTVSYDKLKSNFYSSFNAIYSKLGKTNDVRVPLSLAFSIALPCLLYAQEALPLTKAICKTIELPWSRAFMKIFSTFDIKVIQQCVFHCGFLPVEHYVRLRKINFLKSLKYSPSWVMRCMYDIIAEKEFNWLSGVYNVSQSVLIKNSAQVIYDYFENEVGMIA